MAEFVMKELVKKAGRENEFYIESRATHTDEIWNGEGSPIYPPAREMLLTKGIPFDENKRAALLKKSDLDKFDLFIGMDSENMRWIPRILGSSDKIQKLLERDVYDPWYSRNFEKAYDDILKGCTELLNRI